MNPAPTTPPASRRPLILIVDDMPDIRDMYAEYLAGQGFRPEQASNGFEALSKATVMGPDVIVMDLNLPELDGWEATRRVREAEQTRKVPIIALTAHAMSGDREKAMAAGCDDYDTKPVELDRLLGKIQALLASSG
jgi:two-component system, cell cycle response regulator DivK